MKIEFLVFDPRLCLMAFSLDSKVLQMQGYRYLFWVQLLTFGLLNNLSREMQENWNEAYCAHPVCRWNHYQFQPCWVAGWYCQFQLYQGTRDSLTSHKSLRQHSKDALFIALLLTRYLKSCILAKFHYFQDGEKSWTMCSATSYHLLCTAFFSISSGSQSRLVLGFYRFDLT